MPAWSWVKVKWPAADVEEVVLAHLAPVDDLADPDPDLVGVDEPAGGDRGDDLAEVGVGGGQQGGALAGAFVGQRRVTAGHQPLAGVVGMGDLGEVGLVEQADSWSGPSSAASAATSGARSAVTQPNPPRSRNAAILRTGDHPAVADQHQVGQAELGAHHVDGGGERGRVGGVAGEDPDRDRPAVGVGEQPVVDLWVAAFAVPGVAEGRQRAARAGHIRRAQVEQRHPAGGQVPGGQRGLDGVLAAEQPVQRRVHLVGGRVGHPQVGGQGGVGPPAGGGQLAARAHHPGHQQRERQVPQPARRAEQLRKSQPAGGGDHGSDMPVRQRGHDLHRLAGTARRGEHLPPQHRLDRVDGRVRQRRQVPQRLVLDLPALPEGAAQQMRPVGLRRPRPIRVLTTGRHHMHRT